MNLLTLNLSLLLMLNLLFSAMLTGIIWMVQLVHYPGFLRVGREAGISYQRFHLDRMGWLIVPLMLAELALALWLLFTPMTFIVMEYLNYAAFGLLILVWLVTFLRAVPLHRKLGKEGYEPATTRKLIKTNWWRTAAWSLRTLVLIGLIYFYV